MIGHFRRHLSILLVALGILTAIIMDPQPVRASGPWYVALSGQDINDCLSPSTACLTINAAIEKADPGDSIYVAIGTYTGTGNEVVLINKDISVSGGWDDTFTLQSGVSMIDGEGGTGGAGRRGITVASDVAATLDRLAVQNGNAVLLATILNSGDLTLNDSTVRSTVADNGARGIYNSSSATLTVDRSIITANTSCGICNDGGTVTVSNSIVSGNIASGINNSGTLILINSTVSGNVASAWSNHGGGGIFNNGGSLDIDNSTVSDNLAVGGYSGGGVLNSGGTVTFNSSTISENEVIGGGSGGGISSTGVTTLQNTILSGNFADIGPDCFGATGSAGFNLIGDTTDCSFSPEDGDLSNLDPKLGKLIGTPGEPEYHPLLASSPAIDAGNPTGCTDHLGDSLDTDQRGSPRVGRCDIGSYEFTPPGSPDRIYAYGGTPQRAPPLFEFEEPLQAVVLDASGSPVDNATATFSAPSSGASGTFSDSGTFATSVMTNESGLGTAATFTANQLIGSYVVEASVGGAGAPANFDLTNIAWYVSTDGDDANDCQSPLTTCANINGALAKPDFADGDNVLIASGTYTGTGSEVVLLDIGANLRGGWDADFSTQGDVSTIDGEESRLGIRVNWGTTALIERFLVKDSLSSWGAMLNNGSLTLRNSMVSDNTGGGIFNSGGTLTLRTSTVSGNTGSSTGGGIRNCCNGTVALVDSVISGNSTGAGGGGIRNEGTMTLTDTTITGNTGRGGGGIYNCCGGTLTLDNSDVVANESSSDSGGIEMSGGSLSITNSTLSGNTGDLGGGIGIFGGTVDIDNSTVSGNIANSSGGGIFDNGTLSLNSSTIFGNGAATSGGGILTYRTVTLQNSIVGGNTAPIGPDCSGSFTSSGYNLLSDTSQCSYIPSSGDRVDIDPRMGPLQDNGGPTLTHASHVGSPAINGGNPAGCTDHLGISLDTDQRGFSRVGRCDIGSFEYQGVISQVFLPLLTRDFCADFSDDFSNPSSDWDVVDDAFVRSEYLDGEFRILSKQSGFFYLFTAPTCRRQNYVAEADARWVSDPGSSYGLIFGVLADFSQYYLFDINTDYQEFRLLRRDIGGFTTIVPITSSLAINSGTESNHLKVTRDGDQITLEVNGTALGTWTDGAITGLTFVGIVSNPYYSNPTSDARFDNFSVNGLPGGGAGGQMLSGAAVDAGGTEASGAGQVEVPSEIERWMKEDDVELAGE